MTVKYEYLKNNSTKIKSIIWDCKNKHEAESKIITFQIHGEFLGFKIKTWDLWIDGVSVGTNQ